MVEYYRKLKRKNRELSASLYNADYNYMDKVIRCACSNGIGILEGEIIKRDLIGMGLEAEQLGESLEQRLGNASEFAKELTFGNNKTEKAEKLYYGMWQVGLMLSIVTAIYTFLFGMHKSPISIIFLIGFSLFAVLYYFYSTYISARLSLSGKWYLNVLDFILWIGIFTLFHLIMDYTMDFGLLLSGYTLFILMGLGIALYIAGRILFEKHTAKTAQANHWDISSLL